MTQAPALAVLDDVDPFWYDGTAPMFSDAQLKTIADAGDPEAALLAVIDDPQAALARRFAAVEALAQGGWTAALQRDAPAVAAVLAAAIPEDKMHNRWGLPGHFLGRTGKLFVGLPSGVREALVPLLADCRPLAIIGSQEATLQRTNQYRICDLAGYLIAEHEHATWDDGPDPASREGNLARLQAPR